MSVISGLLKETPMISYKVTLTQAEREQLEAIKAKGSHRSQKVLNALKIRCIPPFPFIDICTVFNDFRYSI